MQYCSLAIYSYSVNIGKLNVFVKLSITLLNRANIKITFINFSFHPIKSPAKQHEMPHIYINDVFIVSSEKFLVKGHSIFLYVEHTKYLHSLSFGGVSCFQNMSGHV